MTDRYEALRRIRTTPDPAQPSSVPREANPARVRFAAVGGRLEERWTAAFAETVGCIRAGRDGRDVLHEGGAYDGTWLESTATIGAETLGRFAPTIARDTVRQFAAWQRDDGMLPYKLTPEGPGWSQIQIVTPLARTVWNLYRAGGRRDREFLDAMYVAMVRYDEWIARYRDTLGTGAVEAFCTFDTGHDASPRFWFAPDRALGGDARLVDPGAALVPYVAPDLTANIACQRAYLARIAEELGTGDAAAWREKARASTDALFAQCFDDADQTFYDRDKHGEFVRIQTDVLARVLACEVGDDAFFAMALERFLLNTRKFLAHYGFTTVALDDPRFDGDATRNSWAGPVNFLAQLRAPHAFEHHGRVAELAAASMPTLTALATADVFPQCIDPFSGAAGYTSEYSPATLWFLDTLERYAGILERPDGTVWATGLAPTRLAHGAQARATAYRRLIDGVEWVLAADDDGADLLRDGALVVRFPRGWRVECGRDGRVAAVVCVSQGTVEGVLEGPSLGSRLRLAPNDRVTLPGGERTSPGFIAPRF